MSDPVRKVINSEDVNEEDYESEEKLDNSDATGNNIDKDGGGIDDQTLPSADELTARENAAENDEVKLAYEQDGNEKYMSVTTTDNRFESEDVKQTDLDTIVSDDKNLTNSRSNELLVEDEKGVALDISLAGRDHETENTNSSQRANLIIDQSANVEANSAVEILSMEQKKSFKDHEDTNEELVQCDGEIETSLATQMTEGLSLKETSSRQRDDMSGELKKEDCNSFSPGDLLSDNKSKTVAGLHSVNNNFQNSTTEAKPRQGETALAREKGSDETEERRVSDDEKNHKNQDSRDHLEMERALCDANTKKEEFVEVVQVSGKQKAIFPQVTLTSPLTETVDFLQQQDVLRIFQELASGIVYERPNEPFQYMIKSLEGMKKRDEEKATKKKKEKTRNSAHKKQRREEKYDS